MDDLFSAKKPTADEYILLRDKEQHAHRREFVESLWTQFHPLADSGFVDLIADDFQPRFWEMYLACTLLDAGLKLSSADAGPDVRVDTGGTPIWVEAISPSGGDGPDAVPSHDTDGDACIVPEDLVVLRLRSAIEEKHNAYLRCIKNGVVSPSDAYIIAVNGRRVPFYMTDDQPSYIIKAVFPFGMHTVTLDSNTAEIVSQGFQHRPQIQKRSGSQVDTTVFENDDYAGISAIVYSSADAWNGPDVLGADFQILHNPLATTPIEHGWLKVGLELWATETELARKQW